VRIRRRKGYRIVCGGNQCVGCTIPGKSAQLEARLVVRTGEGRLVVEDVEAVLDAQSLTTGMQLRDRHLRERVLAPADGTTQPLRFTMVRSALPARCGAPVPDAVEGRWPRYRLARQCGRRAEAHGVEPPS
jgi:hypothetical protein